VHPRVVAMSGSSKGEIYLLKSGKTTVGRDNSNSVQIGDATVSKKHCAIESRDSGFELVDLESHNGTFVNGVPVKRRSLAHGDVIRVGTSEFVFLTQEEKEGEFVELQFSDDATHDSLKTVHLPAIHHGQHSAEIGRMARDYSGLMKLINTINSISDPALLSHSADESTGRRADGGRNL